MKHHFGALYSAPFLFLSPPEQDSGPGGSRLQYHTGRPSCMKAFPLELKFSRESLLLD